MIKKILLGLFTFIGLSISFSSALDYNGTTLIGGSQRNIPLGINGSHYNGSDQSTIDSFTGSINDAFNFGGNFFQYYNSVTYVYWSNDGLKYQNKKGNGVINATINGYFVCSGNPFTSTSFLKDQGCTYYENFFQFSSNLKNISSWGYQIQTTDGSNRLKLCLYSSLNYYVCVDNSYITNVGYSNISPGVASSSAIRNPYLDYVDISFGSSGDIVEISSDLDNSIRFYEDNFNWDINMCYVGTNDLTGAYGKPNVEFEYGSGATIYELYHKIYGTFGNNKIHNVGSFVNVWLLNYATWYKTATEDQIYMATYNGPDQNVSYIYTGFTFPFYNKRLAIYFMADLLSEQYIAESSQGENIVYYCDMKLNYNNYKNGTWNFNDLQNLVDPKIKNRIQDYVNYAINGQDGYSTPDSSSIWGNLMQSGYSIPNDLNPSNLFQDFYNKINGLVTNFTPVTAVGIVPWWILYPMLFLILFRIMRH